MDEYVQVLTTVSSEEEAAKIGGDLLEIIAIQVLAGSKGYLDWISANVDS